MADDQGKGPDVPDQWRVYGEPTGAPRPEPGEDPPARPATWLPDDTPPAPVRSAPEPARPPSLTVAVVIAVAVLVIVVGAGTLILSFRGGGGGFGSTDDATSTEGFSDLLADLEEEAGHTRVFDAVIYPDYAVVQSVAREGDDKYDSYYWDGDLDAPSFGTSSNQPFDLADIEPDVLDGLCGPVIEMVGDVEGDCYLIIRAPWVEGSNTWISAYASNKYFESGRIEYDREGNEIARHEP